MYQVIITFLEECYHLTACLVIKVGLCYEGLDKLLLRLIFTLTVNLSEDAGES